MDGIPFGTGVPAADSRSRVYMRRYIYTTIYISSFAPVLSCPVLSCPVLSSGSNLGGRGPRRRVRARHQLRSREGQGRSVLGPADALQV
jgi:hypothetical protein